MEVGIQVEQYVYVQYLNTKMLLMCGRSKDARIFYDSFSFLLYLQ